MSNGLPVEDEESEKAVLGREEYHLSRIFGIRIILIKVSNNTRDLLE